MKPITSEEGDTTPEPHNSISQKGTTQFEAHPAKSALHSTLLQKNQSCKQHQAATRAKSFFMGAWSCAGWSHWSAGVMHARGWAAPHIPLLCPCTHQGSRMTTGGTNCAAFCQERCWLTLHLTGTSSGIFLAIDESFCKSRQKSHH